MIDKNYKAGAQRGSVNYDAVITLIATPKGKFPPQAGKIIEALLAAKDNTLTVGEMIGTDGSTESALMKAGLQTTQDGGANDIWTHYRKRLIEEKLITIS
jgi:hypothetical protein